MNQEDYGTVFRFDIPATFKYLNVVSSSLTAVLEHADNLPERDILIYNIILAVHEICTNIVEHAYAGREGRIKLVVCLDDKLDRIVVDVYDTGQRFDLDSTPMPDLDEALVRGYGLFLIRELMDEVSYLPGAEQNHWRLMKKTV